MELFIKVVFWTSLLSCVLRLILMGVREYPYETIHTLGGDLVNFIEAAVFVVWGGILIWGAR